MANVSFSRLSVLPAVLIANMIYIVSSGEDQFELIITGDDAANPRRMDMAQLVGPEPEVIPNTPIEGSDLIQLAIYKLRDQITASRLTDAEVLAIQVRYLDRATTAAVETGDSLVLCIEKLQNQVTVLKQHPGPAVLYKPFSMEGPCIKKLYASVAYVKQGTQFRTADGLFTVSTDLEIEQLDPYEQGQDYEVFISSSMAPVAALAGRLQQEGGPGNTDGRIMIGGFHYSCMNYDTDIPGGEFNTDPANGGMVWTPEDVDKIVGINEFSIWDLNYRPVCSPRGMARVTNPNGRVLFWFDIYLCNQMPEVIGTSSFDRSITNQSFIPAVSPLFPNGLAQYQQLSWFTAAEIGATAGKRMMSYREFTLAAFGVTENISYGTATPNPESTGFLPGFTSKWGGMQMSGTFWVWGGEPIVDPASGNNIWIEGDRGDFSGNIRGLRFGGAYDNSIRSGSQCISAEAAANYGQSLTSMRFAADHFDRNPNIVLN